MQISLLDTLNIGGQYCRFINFCRAFVLCCEEFELWKLSCTNTLEVGRLLTCHVMEFLPARHASMPTLHTPFFIFSPVARQVLLSLTAYPSE